MEWVIFHSLPPSNSLDAPRSTSRGRTFPWPRSGRTGSPAPTWSWGASGRGSSASATSGSTGKSIPRWRPNWTERQLFHCKQKRGGTEKKELRKKTKQSQSGLNSLSTQVYYMREKTEQSGEQLMQQQFWLMFQHMFAIYASKAHVSEATRAFGS